MIGRLGFIADLEARLEMVRKQGGTTSIDKDDAGTAEAKHADGTVILRALRKDERTWLVMYHPDYWQGL